MAVRTKRLSTRVTATSGGPAVTLYTCPAGKTAIVKLLVARSTSALNGSWSAGVWPGGSSALSMECAREASNVATTWREQLEWVVLEPGDKFVAQSTGMATDFMIFGTELDGVAP